MSSTIAEGEAVKQRAVDGKTAGLLETQTVDAQATALPEDLAKRFQSVRELGRGGFGRVVLAIDRKMNRQVAIKLPLEKRTSNDQDITIYLREARAWAKLQHPNIAIIHEVGETPTIPIYQICAYIPGQDLTDIIRSGEAVDERTLAQWFADVASAVHHLHSQGLLHRDIKPRNIRINDKGIAYLLDFGLTTRIESLDRSQSATESSQGKYMAAGTPQYMSPEQRLGLPMQASSDVYSLGVALFEAITGRRPYTGNQLLDGALAQKPSPKTLHPTLSLDLDAICRKALEPRPADRYQSAAEMEADLRRFLAGKPATGARAVGGTEAVSHWWADHWKLASLGGLAAVLAVVAAVATFVALRRDDGKVTFHIPTVPPGANLFLVPTDVETGLYDPKNGIHGYGDADMRALPGMYLVVAYLPNDPRFHEVLRTVPPDPAKVEKGKLLLPDAMKQARWEIVHNRIELPKITLVANGADVEMVRCEGGKRLKVGKLGDIMFPERVVDVPPFLVDAVEVPNLEYGKKVKSKPTSRPRGMDLPPQNPATYVNFYEAATYAELMGKRLPDEYEFLWIASHSKPAAEREPMNNALAWRLDPVDDNELDQITLPGGGIVRGLLSNAGEWTTSFASLRLLVDGGIPPGQIRVIRGAKEGAANGKAPNVLATLHDRVPHEIYPGEPGVGFRCVKSMRPRTTPEDFVRVSR